jgi:hypothetical protein
MNQKGRRRNAMKSKVSSILRQNILSTALIFLLPLCLLTANAPAQTESRDLPGDDGEKIVVNVWASTPPNEAPGPPLSRDFVIAGLRAMTALREWQGQLATTIRNGYPLAEDGIAVYRDRSADRLTLAAVAASTNADRAALNELAHQHENLSQWSNELVDANRNLELAKLYMSPEALEEDSLFQKTVECANFLAPMLASGHLREDVMCR